MIHYICGYSEADTGVERQCSPAGVTKMRYIMQCLDELNAKYCVYSTCQVIQPWFHRKFKRGNIIYRGSIATDNKYLFYFDRLFAIFQLVIYLLRIPSKDTVLVYHECFYTRWVNLVYGIKKWNLIWEIEEIYTMVGDNAPRLVKKEIDGLGRIRPNCGGYILSTGMLKKYFHGESVVCSGTYFPLNMDKQRQKRHQIHVVYGGTLDKEKGGAYAAAMAARYLDEGYHVHILGFGTESQIAEIKKLVMDVQSESRARITYDGVLFGEEYQKFLKTCDIGLSTQNPHAAYNNTSFPSKVMEYLRCGVNVVSADIPVVRESVADSLVSYYKNQVPSEIADAILNAKLYSHEEIESVLTNAHAAFKMEVKRLLNI